MKNLVNIIKTAVIAIPLVFAGCAQFSQSAHSSRHDRNFTRYENPHSVKKISLTGYNPSMPVESSHITINGDTFYLERNYLETGDLPFILRKADSSRIELDDKLKTAHLSSPNLYYGQICTNSLGKKVRGVNLEKDGPKGIWAERSFTNEQISPQGKFSLGSFSNFKFSKPLYQFCIDPDGKGPLPPVSYFSIERKSDTSDLPFSFIPYTSDCIKIDFSPEDSKGRISLVPGVVYEFRNMSEEKAREHLKNLENKKTGNSPVIESISTKDIFN